MLKPSEAEKMWKKLRPMIPSLPKLIYQIHNKEMFLISIMVTALLESMCGHLSSRDGMAILTRLNWLRLNLMIWVPCWEFTGNTKLRIWIALFLRKLAKSNSLLLKMMQSNCIKFLRKDWKNFHLFWWLISGRRKSKWRKSNYSKGRSQC